MKRATRRTSEKILRLTEDPNEVRLTEKAKWGLMGSSLTKVGLCDEISDWIINGQALHEKVTTEPPEHRGKIVYILKPRIDETLYYIRMGIEEDEMGNERLIVISMHPDV